MNDVATIDTQLKTLLGVARNFLEPAGHRDESTRRCQEFAQMVPIISHVGALNVNKPYVGGAEL